MCTKEHNFCVTVSNTFSNASVQFTIDYFSFGCVLL